MVGLYVGLTSAYPASAEIADRNYLTQAEFGRPAELLQNEKGMLRALVNESTDKEKLHELAGAIF